MKQFFTPKQCLFLVVFLCMARLSSAQLPYMVKYLKATNATAPYGLTNVNGVLYFSAYDENLTYGEELWRSDGTAGGTYMLKDINPGGGNSEVANIIDINGKLFFRAYDDTYALRLWKSDGTPEGTGRVSSDVSIGGSMVKVNETIYFTGNTSANGYELWKSDGTSSGTSLVKDINPGSASAFIYYLTNVNGTLYFRTAYNDFMELWKSDGTTSGTELVKQFSGTSDLSNFTNVNDTLLFTVNDGINGKELWKSDGTIEGTILVKDINPGASGSAITEIISVGNTAYFTATHVSYGRELWKSDGSESGTVMIKDIFPGSSGANPQRLVNVNGAVFFIAADGIHGQELWKTDGMEAGTELVKDIYPDASTSSIENPVNVNGTLYFWAENGINGSELWKSDGTEAGTLLVKDIYPGYTGYSGYFPTNVEGKLYFVASTKIDGIDYNSELWSMGACATTNAIITDRSKASVYNSQVQGSSATTTCHCDVFNNLIATTDATGDNPISGKINSKVWIGTANESYVKRHYEIYPETNPDNTTARVTFYFTQADFDDYNTAIAASVPKLPTDNTDNVGISSILIEKRAGTSTTGLPDSYTGEISTINPDDTDIVWNSTSARWEVSFTTTGFGGFFLKSPELTDPTDISVSSTAICNSETVSLSATCADGTLNWYTIASGGSSIGTSSPLAVSPSSTTTYYAACEYGMNATNRVATGEVIVTAIPAIPEDVMVENANICSGQSVFLTATCPTGTIVWYNAASGGDYIGTGNIVTPTPTSNTTYYAACENGICKSERVATSEVIITQQVFKPTGVSVDKTAICSGTEIILTANCTIGTITWYNEEEGGTAIGTGNSLSQTPDYSYTYYAACENGLCISQRVATEYVYVTYQPTMPTDVSLSDTSICSGTTISLLASCEVGDPTWYTQATGGTSIGINSSLDQTPSSTTTYYIACENRSCISERVLAGEVKVIPAPAKPTNLSQWSTTACTGGSVGLSGSCAGATLKWYESATATTPAYQGSDVYANPTRTIIYYAACETTYCSSERVAMQEIVFYDMPDNPTGVTVNKTAICKGDSVSLSGSCAIGSIKWIRTYTTGDVEQYDLTPTYAPTETSVYYAYCINGTCISDYLPTGTVVVSEQPGIPTDLFQGGTQICVGTGIYLNASCATGTLSWYDAASGGTVLGTGAFFIARPTTTTTYYVACENSNCKSQRVALNEIVVYPQPVNPTGVSVSKTAICNGETITLSGSCLIGTIRWYKTSMDPDTAFNYTPKVNTVYHATCSNEFCSSESVATAEVEVTQQPANPTNVSVDKTVICSGESIILTATCSLGTVTWYNSSTGSTIVGTGNNLNPNPTATITYYATCVNGICISGRIATNEITVKPKPATPVISGRNTICAGESVNLTASASVIEPASVLHWSGGLSGITLNLSPIVSTNYKVAVNYDGCTSDSSAVFTVTVNPTPIQPTITADNPTICRGNTVVLNAQCPGITDSFYWSSSAVSGSNAPGAYYKSTRAITEPGTYTGWCTSNTGCKGPEKSIVITPGSNCGGKNFITISPARPVICPGSSVTLTAAGCTGTITWLGGTNNQTGTSISISPVSGTTWLAQCSTGGFASVDVEVAMSSVVVSTNITTGLEQIKALNTIESAMKIGDPDFTPAPVVSFDAGKSITLKPGFVADARSVFKAEIKGCN